MRSLTWRREGGQRSCLQWPVGEVRAADPPWLRLSRSSASLPCVSSSFTPRSCRYRAANAGRRAVEGCLAGGEGRNGVRGG
jgi:hypothetical protein